MVQSIKSPLGKRRRVNGLTTLDLMHNDWWLQLLRDWSPADSAACSAAGSGMSEASDATGQSTLATDEVSISPMQNVTAIMACCSLDPATVFPNPKIQKISNTMFHLTRNLAYRLRSSLLLKWH